MLVLIVANFFVHRGKYFPSGQPNFLEEFDNDQGFLDFLDFYSSGIYFQKPVHLVFNGNFLNLLLVDIHGVYPHDIDEDITLQSLQKIVIGHPKLFAGLQKFLSIPNKHLSYLWGTQDCGLLFLRAQHFLNAKIGKEIQFFLKLKLGPVVIVGPLARRNANFRTGTWGEKFLKLTLPQRLSIELSPIIKKLKYPPYTISWRQRWKGKKIIFCRRAQILGRFAYTSRLNFFSCIVWVWRIVFPRALRPISSTAIGTVYAEGENTFLAIDENARWVINLAVAANDQSPGAKWQYAIVELDPAMQQIKNYALLEWKSS